MDVCEGLVDGDNRGLESSQGTNSSVLHRRYDVKVKKLEERERLNLHSSDVMIVQDNLASSALFCGENLQRFVKEVRIDDEV